MPADRPAAPETAALAVARSVGLGVERAHVVHSGSFVLVRLEPRPVAARVTGDGPPPAFAGALDAEVRVAAALHAAGAPVVPPLPGVPARAWPAAARQVALWTWWDDAGGDEDPAPAGRPPRPPHPPPPARRPPPP